ncbi:MAG: 2,3,4,5-tetrahydropyridine-2,6-dicarboxylate N-succinyltransferase [bacterium]|nr:2,3,4,5-tetrahydropyridine-2,6-dicarboxylate N-succinyltransferase [bacterium]
MLQNVENFWEDRAKFSPKDHPDDLRDVVDSVLLRLDHGSYRAAMKLGETWFTNQAVKKAVLLSFKINGNKVIEGGCDAGLRYFDKVPLKFCRWGHDDFSSSGFRVVPGAVARSGSFIGENVVLMPSFVNVGAYVGGGTMVDTWATVGSCAQIGRNCHLSGGVGIGGVLEPVQASPTIIEDNCFIGARSEVAEGVIVREGAVLSMGVFIGKNTPIVDRTRGNVVIRGEVPPRAVVMMGVHPENGLICPQIVKYRDSQTDAATALNELLRD